MITLEDLCRDTLLEPQNATVEVFDCESTGMDEFQAFYIVKTKLLGEGHYSKVREASRRLSDNNTTYAVKCVDRSKLSKKEDQSIRNEVDILRDLKDAPNVVQFYDFFSSPKEYYLVMDHLQGGDLFDRIVAKGRYKETEAKQTFAKLLQAVHYCHQNSIIHRDLKPDNILLCSTDNDVDIKLADFGFAKKMEKPNRCTTICGTLGYMAPEMLNKVPYGEQVDMFGVGVILYILLCGEPPFYNETSTQEMFRQNSECDFDFHQPIWDDISTRAKELISSLLLVDPSERLGASQALKSPWIKGIQRRGLNNNNGTKECKLFKSFKRTAKTFFSVRNINGHAVCA